MSRMSRFLTGTCAAALAIGAGAPVVAQNDDGVFVIEEIIVTARMREENLNSTPLAITALTGDTIAKLGIRDVRALVDQSPSIYYTNQGGGGLGMVSMRGLSQAALVGDEANVATFVDGFYWAGRMAFEQFFDGLERVEIVRGPQSALYGRNSFSGAINYISKKPLMDDHEYGGRITYGDKGKKAFGGYVTTPIVEGKVGFRIDFTHDETGGTHVNSTDGQRLGDSNSENLRARVLFTPSDNLTIDYAFTYIDRQTTQWPLYAVPFNELDSGIQADFISFSYRPKKQQFPVERPLDDMDRLSSPYTGDTYEVERHTFDIDYEMDWAIASVLISATDETYTAISDASYGVGGEIILGQAMNFAPYFDPNTGQTMAPFTDLQFFPVDLDGNFIPDLFPIVGGQPNQDRKDFSGELRLQSNSEGPLSWQVGGFFSRLKYDDKLLLGYDIDAATEMGAMFHVPSYLAATHFPLGAIFPAEYDCDVLMAAGGASPCMGPPNLLGTWRIVDGEIPVIQHNTFRNEEASVFAQVGYDISDRTRISLEGRMTWEDRQMIDVKDTTLYFDQAGGRELTKNFSTFTPRVLFDHQYNDDVFFYMVVAKGAKAGGVQPSSSDGGGFYLPEENWTYEAGTKLTMMQGAMQFNLSAFFVDWTNMQVRDNITLANEVGNIGKAEVKGLEIEGTWRLNEALTLNYGYSYQDGKITEGVVASARGYCDMPHLEHEEVAPSAAIWGSSPAIWEACGFNPFIGDMTISVTTGDITGNRLPNAPKHTAVFGANVSVPINDDMNFFARMDMNYRSNIFYDNINWAQSGDMVNVNAQAGVDGENWRLSFWVQNATDERALASAIRNFNALGQIIFGIQHREGRKFGATLSFQY